MIVLVHHADAVGSKVDAQRPLSTAGRMHADRLAADLTTRDVRPSAIWHSGKLRARQTAEALLRACNPLAEFAAIRGLQADRSTRVDSRSTRWGDPRRHDRRPHAQPSAYPATLAARRTRQQPRVSPARSGGPRSGWGSVAASLDGGVTGGRIRGGLTTCGSGDRTDQEIRSPPDLLISCSISIVSIRT